MLKEKIKNFVLLYISLLIYSGTTVCSKYAALATKLDHRAQFFIFIGLEIFCLGVYALLWQQVLKKFELITAMSNKGVVVIFGLVWSVLLFSERVTWQNILGALIIIAGIWVVSADD